MQYKVLMAYEDHAVGDMVELDEAQAEALVAAGILEAAEGAAEEEAEEAAPVMEDKALKSLEQRFQASLNKGVELAVKKIKATNYLPNVTTPAQVAAPVFKSMGELLYHGWRAKKLSDRNSANKLEAYRKEGLRTKAPLGAAETPQSAGGYAIKPVWWKEIYDKVRDYPHLMDKCEIWPINSSTIDIPTVAEASLADGQRHGGVTGFYVNEGTPVTFTNPALGNITAVLQTLVVCVPVTQQLLEDANVEAFDRFVGRMSAKEILWKENDAVINGAAGINGILLQPSLVTVAPEASQAAKTLSYQNLVKMYNALWPPSRSGGRACYLMNPSWYAQLASLTFPNQAGVYPAQGLSYNAADETPYRFQGIPIIETLNSPQLGAAGSIILADLGELIVAQHNSNVVADYSEHFAFNTLQTIFRFYRRYTASSGWLTNVKSVDGNFTWSPFVSMGLIGT